MTSLPALRAWMRIARGTAFAAIALALAGPVPAQIQIPGLLSSPAKDAKDPAKGPEAETPAQGLARAKRQLDETRAALDWSPVEKRFTGDDGMLPFLFNIWFKTPIVEAQYNLSTGKDNESLEAPAG